MRSPAGPRVHRDCISRHQPSPTVNPKLAQRVWNAIKELGYYPNTQARALVSGAAGYRTHCLGTYKPFFPKSSKFSKPLQFRHHYEILLTSTMNDPEQMESSVRRMIERQVEGVAVMTFGMEEALLEDLKLRQVPLVFVDVGPHRPRVSNLRCRLPERHSPGGSARGCAETRENCLHHRTSHTQVSHGPESRPS